MLFVNIVKFVAICGLLLPMILNVMQSADQGVICVLFTQMLVPLFYQVYSKLRFAEGGLNSPTTTPPAVLVRL